MRFSLLGGHEITEALYAQYEQEPQESGIEYSEGDSVFVKAAAWKSSFYRNTWPYEVEISSAFFEARIERLCKGSRFQLSFSAFEMDSAKSEYSRYPAIYFILLSIYVPARFDVDRFYLDILCLPCPGEGL